MRQISFLILFFFVSQRTSASIAHEWKDTTPKGYKIEEIDRDFIRYYNKSGTQILKGLTSWYFYKDFTIGKFNSLSRNENKESLGLKYFVSNELCDTLIRFKEEIEFKEYLISHNLIPNITTRWYRSFWSNHPDKNVTLTLEPFLTTFFIFIGYLILISLTLIVSLFKMKFLKSFLLRISAIFIVSILLFRTTYWLLHEYPMSF